MPTNTTTAILIDTGVRPDPDDTPFPETVAVSSPAGTITADVLTTDTVLQSQPYTIQVHIDVPSDVRPVSVSMPLEIQTAEFKSTVAADKARKQAIELVGLVEEARSDFPHTADRDIAAAKLDVARFTKYRAELDGTPTRVPKHAIETLCVLLEHGEISRPILYYGSQSLRFTTADIFISTSKFNFGRFAVELNIRNGTVNVFPTGNNTERGGVYHPHVSKEGKACMGYLASDSARSVSDELAWQFVNCNLDQVVLLILSYLRSYNPEDRHQKITAWDNSYTTDDFCDSCEYSTDECDCAWCDSCSSNVSSDSMAGCGVCTECCDNNHSSCDSCSECYSPAGRSNSNCHTCDSCCDDLHVRCTDCHTCLGEEYPEQCARPGCGAKYCTSCQRDLDDCTCSNEPYVYSNDPGVY